MRSASWEKIIIEIKIMTCQFPKYTVEYLNDTIRCAYSWEFLAEVADGNRA